MLPRAGRRSAFIALGVAVIALGWSSSTPVQALGGGFDIALKVKGKKGKNRVYGAKRATEIVGVVRSHPGGVGGVPIQLYKNQFPYGNPIPVKSTVTGPGGRFSFKVRPQINARYRAISLVAPQIRSAQRQVWVFARVRTRRLRVNQRKGVVRSGMSLRYSPDVNPDFYRGNRVFWYFRKVSQSTFKRVKTTRLRKRRGGGVRTRARYRLPRSRRDYRFHFSWCIKAPPRDVGVGNDRPGRCPRKIKVR